MNKINKILTIGITGLMVMSQCITAMAATDWDWNKGTLTPADFAGCPYNFGDVILDPQSAVTNDVGATIDHSCTDDYFIGYGIDYKMPAMWQKFSDVYNLAPDIAPMCVVTGNVTINATLSKDLDTSTFTTQSVIDSFKAENDPGFVALWDNYDCTFDTDNNLTFTMSFRNGVTGAEVKAVADNNPIIKLTFDKVKLPNDKFDVGQTIDVTNVSFEEDINILAPAIFRSILLGTVHVSADGNDDTILERGKLEYEYRSGETIALPAEIKALEPVAETTKARPTLDTLTQPSTSEVSVDGKTWVFKGYASIETYADNNGITCEKDICDGKNAHLEAIGVWVLKTEETTEEETTTVPVATPTEAEETTKAHINGGSSGSSGGSSVHSVPQTSASTPETSAEIVAPSINGNNSQINNGVTLNPDGSVPVGYKLINGKLVPIDIPKTGEENHTGIALLFALITILFSTSAFYFSRKKALVKVKK